MANAKARATDEAAIPEVTMDPVESARAAGLRYMSDAQPGISRRRAGRGFSYKGPDGEKISDPETLARIKSLAVPPAWREVWISPHPKGHLQATGKDARGRKQYRYHPRWREVRDRMKYQRMIIFGQALPRIRERIEQDLARPALPKEKVLATVVRLLESTLIRVGNEEYARANASYGLTTLRNRHVEVRGGRLRFEFKGKSGKMHSIGIHDRRVARVVKKCQELPERELFEYVEADGTRHPISSADVNAYLKEISGEEFTAKDFRTWAGTVLAATALQEMEAAETKTGARKNVVRAIEQVAERLGNTPAICRKCYVHPAVLDSYLAGTLAEALEQPGDEVLAESLSLLPSDEAAVLAFLHGQSAAPRRRKQRRRRTG